MNPEQTSALAVYFAGRIEKARDALCAVRLTEYADEVCIMLPTSAEAFPRFVHWCEALHSLMERWSVRPDVRARTDGKELDTALDAVTVLARDARALLTLIENRRARRA